MADRLKIYACSGIGDSNTNETYNYWTDNTDTLNNTRAVNSLLIDINDAWMKATCFKGLTDEQRLNYMNSVDLYVVCLKAAQQFSNNPEMLHRAGVVIGQMSKDGLFAFDSFDGEARDKHLDELLETAQSAYYSDEQFVAYSQFMAWWKVNVENLNVPTFSEEKKSKIRAAIAGIGDTKIPTDPMQMIREAGTYYIYTYFTKAQINKLPGKNRAIVERKVNYQWQIYNYNESYCVGICGSEKKVRELCTYNVERQFGKPVSQVIDEMVQNGGKVSGIGVLTEAAATIIVAIVTAIVQIVLALIGKSAAAATTNSQNYQKPTQTTVRNGQMDDGDIPVPEGLQKAANFIPFIAIGAAALFLMKD